MNADAVAAYLKTNPQFFEQYASLLADILIPHPHGGRTISLSERQMLVLREKNRQLEKKLAELLSFGEANDALSDKMHRLAVALITSESLSAALSLAHFHLREDFAISHIAFCLWDRPKNARGGELPAFVHINEALQAFCETLGKSWCGLAETHGALWFGEQAAHIRSQALIPLKEGSTSGSIGMIALGSEDRERFYPDMGTLYLERLGELVSAVLARLAQ
ncbi:MAG: DUF484 family protein [Zoogloeaceae bacterium]|jgi:uncharacterized protein YigA (DUF484 family)|nr:DUF484 family protein [Zoogloeaceae bacterium]